MNYAGTDTAVECQVQWDVRQRLGYGISRSSSLGTGDKWPLDYIQNNPNARERSISKINCWLTFYKPNRILAPSQRPAENRTERYKSVIHSIRTYIHTYKLVPNPRGYLRISDNCHLPTEKDSR